MPTHAEKRHVPYEAEKLFELVVDVERYPDFLPWCVASRIRRREGSDAFVADLVIGYKMFRERFTSHVRMQRPLRVDVAYFEGPFKYLNNHWIFEPHEDGGCVVDFYVDFEFRSRALQKVIKTVFNEAVQRMVDAFDKRARSLYGLEPDDSPTGSPVQPATKQS